MAVQLQTHAAGLVKPLCICVHLITYSHTDPTTAAFPVRSLSQGPDYRPDWRWQTCERYLVQVSSAKDTEAEVEYILARERDPYLRQLLVFHTNRRCVISDAIRYAMSCRATNPENRIGSLIKAMTIAVRTSAQIASEFGTEALNIITYQKIFFDVRRYLDRRGWLKRLCFPAYQHQPSAEEECEARWLQVAYTRGWAGLAGLIFDHKPYQSGEAELSRLVRVLLARSNDYVSSLEAVGVPATERDLQLLILVQHWIEGLGLPLELEHLNFIEPLDPEEEKRQNEAKETVSKLTPLARKKITAILEKAKVWAEDPES